MARGKPGGRLIFETRDPARQAWREWDRSHTDTVANMAGIGRVRAVDAIRDAPDRPGRESVFIATAG